MFFRLQHWPLLGGVVFRSLTGVGSLGLDNLGVVWKVGEDRFATNEKKNIYVKTW